MKLLAATLLAYGAGSLSTAQSSALSAVEARQTEVIRLGQQIYRIDLSASGWSHELAPICPAFKHHVFARYQRTVAGRQEAYLAVLPLDVAGPAPEAKPWRGGIVLLNLQAKDKPVADQQNTITIFNHVWSYELAHSGQSQAFPDLGWSGLAACYARFTDEAPRSTKANDGPGDPINLKTLTPTSIDLPLQDSVNHSRSLDIEFFQNGLLKQVRMNELPLDPAP